MGVLDNAKSHYKGQLSRTPRRIEIPEWGDGDSPLVAYVRPSINLSSMSTILELSTEGKTAEALALTIIFRLMDDEGQPVFRKADKLSLISEVDPEVIGRVATEINQGDPTEEEIAKN